MLNVRIGRDWASMRDKRMASWFNDPWKIFIFQSVDEMLATKIRHYFLLASFFVPTHAIAKDYTIDFTLSRG